MPFHFTNHYTRDEVRSLLPQIRGWLEKLRASLAEVAKYEKRITGLLAPGQDLGGEMVNRWVKAVVAVEQLFAEFSKREIQIKDVDRGLLDFPAIIGGREVFLCWEQDDDDIEFWHELDSGFAGREPL
ncbi:MAG: DUF2203 domain-containing protein [Verrucomicrobiota bacterium]|jgi:hypothetical protein|nr:DUF2203 domain-containing protein [Verrucomicrobiota bacterium]